jgi:hypothetical protein
LTHDSPDSQSLLVMQKRRLFAGEEGEGGGALGTGVSTCLWGSVTLPQTPPLSLGGRMHFSFAKASQSMSVTHSFAKDGGEKSRVKMNDRKSIAVSAFMSCLFSQEVSCQELFHYT